MVEGTRDPEEKPDYLCMKHQTHANEEDLRCRDPEIYCKFRTSCPIHFLSKEGNAEMIEDATKEGSP